MNWNFNLKMDVRVAELPLIYILRIRIIPIKHPQNSSEISQKLFDFQMRAYKVRALTIACWLHLVRS